MIQLLYRYHLIYTIKKLKHFYSCKCITICWVFFNFLALLPLSYYTFFWDISNIRCVGHSDCHILLITKEAVLRSWDRVQGRLRLLVSPLSMEIKNTARPYVARISNKVAPTLDLRSWVSPETAAWFLSGCGETWVPSSRLKGATCLNQMSVGRRRRYLVVLSLDNITSSKTYMFCHFSENL